MAHASHLMDTAYAPNEFLKECKIRPLDEVFKSEFQHSKDGCGLLDDVEDLLRFLHFGVARSLLGHLPPELPKKKNALASHNLLANAC
jgi:hypothetical protein